MKNGRWVALCAAVMLVSVGSTAVAGARLGLTDRATTIALPPPATWRLLLGGQARIGLDPVAGCPRDAGFGGRNVDSVSGWSETHVQPHLVVGDVEAGQSLIPRKLRRIRSLTRSLTTARRVPKNAPPGMN